MAEQPWDSSLFRDSVAYQNLVPLIKLDLLFLFAFFTRCAVIVAIGGYTPCVKASTKRSTLPFRKERIPSGLVGNVL